jgi:hypothetical protein
VSLAAAFSLSVSCLSDAGRGPETEPVQPRTIVFSLAGTSSATRAADDIVGNEGVIERLDVFFFDAAGVQMFYPEPRQLVRDGVRVTITIPEVTYNALTSETSCTIYLVANTLLSREQMAGKTLAELTATVTGNAATRLFNPPNAHPADFLMTGSVAASIDPDGTDLGSVSLRRAAAKVLVDISSATTPGGLVPVRARARLSNYVDKTRLGDETLPDGLTDDDFAISGWQTLTPTGGTGNTFEMDVENALYSYHNDWTDPHHNRETYITLQIDWALDDQGSGVRSYYYRIPFSYIRADNATAAAFHRDRIRRNYVYHFMVNVTDLGGVDPEDAVDLEAGFDVIDWTERQVEVSILTYHYLFVYNSNMQVHDRPGYEWEYRSSLPLQWKVESVTCTEFTPEGPTNDVVYAPGDPQWPIIELREEGGRTFLGVLSMVPLNYVPLEIRLRVWNDAELYNSVSLTIFPPKYVTSSFSDGGTNQTRYPRAGAYGSSAGNENNGRWGNNNPNGESANDNFNFYRITTTALDNRQILIGNTLQTILLGDPTETVTHPFPDVSTYQRTDPDANHVVSPEFVIASRRGITTSMAWDVARDRCTRYREAQYPAGTWRVPTFAELAMLGDMQNDPRSAIKGLFVPVATGSNPGWWTALDAYRIQVHLYTYAAGAGVETDGSGSVRCVHDTWRDS